MFYRNQAGAFKKNEMKHMRAVFYPTEARGICIKGQQSACDYSVTSANGSEESTQNPVYNVNTQSGAVMSRSSSVLIEKNKNTMRRCWINDCYTWIDQQHSKGYKWSEFLSATDQMRQFDIHSIKTSQYSKMLQYTGSWLLI